MIYLRFSSSKTTCCCSPTQLATPLATPLARGAPGGQRGSVEKRQVDVKESIILMDLASKAIISKFSERMNDGRKHTTALKRMKII